MNKNILYLIMTAIGAVALLFATVFLLISWPNIPNEIPLHYNFAGEVTNYGGKGSIWVLLTAAWVAFIAMTVVVRFPNAWNMPVEVTEENCERLYSITRGFLEAVKLEVVLLMVMLLVTSAKGVELSMALMMIPMAAIITTIVIGMAMLRRNK